MELLSLHAGAKLLKVDRSTLQRAVDTYTPPPSGIRAGHAVWRFAVLADALELERLDAAPGLFPHARYESFWIVLAALDRGEAVDAQRLDELLILEPEEFRRSTLPRGPARGTGDTSAPATPGAHDGRGRIDGTGRQQPGAAETERRGNICASREGRAPDSQLPETDSDAPGQARPKAAGAADGVLRS